MGCSVVGVVGAVPAALLSVDLHDAELPSAELAPDQRRSQHRDTDTYPALNVGAKHFRALERVNNHEYQRDTGHYAVPVFPCAREQCAVLGAGILKIGHSGNTDKERLRKVAVPLPAVRYR